MFDYWRVIHRYVQSNPTGRVFPKQNGRVRILESIPQYTPYGKLEKCQTYELMNCRKFCPHAVVPVDMMAQVGKWHTSVYSHSSTVFSSFRYYMVLVSE